MLCFLEPNIKESQCQCTRHNSTKGKLKDQGQPCARARLRQASACLMKKKNLVTSARQKHSCHLCRRASPARTKVVLRYDPRHTSQDWEERGLTVSFACLLPKSPCLVVQPPCVSSPRGWAPQQARACGFFFNHILCFTKIRAQGGGECVCRTWSLVNLPRVSPCQYWGKTLAAAFERSVCGFCWKGRLRLSLLGPQKRLLTNYTNPVCSTGGIRRG